MLDAPRIVRHPSGQAYCTTEYVPADHWLRTTWRGFISPADAEQGALALLDMLQYGPIDCLLNDNSLVQGPWFDSISWLQQIWVPQATRLGLRHVAHVAQPHTEADLGALLVREPFGNLFDVQLFTDLDEATDWLRACQQPN